MTRRTIFGARLSQHASGGHASPAVATHGREIPYAEMFGQVENCAAWLTRRGCRPPDVVGITIADEYMHMVASLALLNLGIPQVCLPTHDPASMRLHLTRRLAIGRVIVTDPQEVHLDSDALLLTPEILHAAGRTEPPAALDDDPDAPAVYFTSSGTTGDHKIFAMSQHAVAWRAKRMVESEAIVPGFRALMPASVEHSPAKAKRLYTCYLGFTSVFQPRSSPGVSTQANCASLDVTCLELSVLQVTGIVQDRTDERLFPARTTVYASGSRVPAKLRQEFNTRFGMPLFVHYGAREIGRVATTYLQAEADALESVGVPVPWMDVEIVDDDGGVLSAGEVGELRLRSECMTNEYYHDPVATSRHFRNGWFYPGDLASLTPGGALCLHGRADDMMTLNGIKIFPAEIERVLEEHPGVKAAAAFARSSDVHGDIPIAAVELHGSASVGDDELLACARERLGVRAPRRIIVVAALPRNAAGKILKRRLVELVALDK